MCCRACGRGAGARARTLLVLLQTLGPYLAQRVAAATAAAALQAEGERQAAAAPGTTPIPRCWLWRPSGGGCGACSVSKRAADGPEQATVGSGGG